MRCPLAPGRGFVLTAIALVALDAAAQDMTQEVKSWLDRMNDAVETLSYEGTFVRVFDGNAETLHIVHRNSDGDVREKISSFGDAGREILREGQRVQCVLPERRVVLLESPDNSSSPISSSLPDYSDGLKANYELASHRKGQVAQRDTQIVIIRPKDDLRYGYVLWLDQETAMPLKSQVRDETGAVVEQILFTDFEIRDSIDDSEFDSTIDTDGFRWIRSREYEDYSNDQVTWRANELPSGFEMSVARRSAIAGLDNPVYHLVFSDGLATVSVFVADSEADVEEGYSRLGSTNSYSLNMRGRKVTAMGEVPRQTVRRIAASLDTSTDDAADSR
jgi:sigma-E factor negative regulatory protein RseB